VQKTAGLLNSFALLAVAAAAAAVGLKNYEGDTSHRILNVSYDPTRELYAELNPVFIARYKKETGTALVVKQSHGGSSRQARTLFNGVDADVVTLALPSDIDGLRKHGLIAEGWRERLPNHSEPYTSTIVFVVRGGNPKGIHDWPDLVRPGISIVTPNPKTSGNGKLSVLAAWGSVLYRGGTEAQAQGFLGALYSHVSVLGTGSRDSATTFTEDKVGDVQLTWENEALRETEDSKGELEIVRPPVSIRAEPSVAWVDAVVSRRHTETYARAYLSFLFTAAAQEIIARNGYRPIDPDALRRHAEKLPPITLFPVSLVAKDWDEAQTRFFGDNGIFDLIYQPHGK